MASKQYIEIPLPSLIHRIGGEKVKQAKGIAVEYDCLLSRVRRSRHWRLSGDAIAIQSYKEQLQYLADDRFRFLIQKVEAALLAHPDKLETLEQKLARLIAENPNVTLAELIELTQCTLAEARIARDRADAW
ncbi:ribosome recycling factor family protein [Shewanella gelidii]|uniref:Ribosome recycling factor n=1 Tax=Shewanella gelidii TaxID=1642821 RepID=A0A917JLL8_9GAMM|nr:ribosome recycling factor family protein [Shewanella gelidii]MCL1096986.1 ribosome recycling factor family protein [Shewanella gelidii]GGI71730.1 ribosome recycling factor [Shewanella gelidii]